MTDYIDRGQKIEVQFLPKIKLHCTYRFYNYVSEAVTIFADVYCNMWFDSIEYLRKYKTLHIFSELVYRYINTSGSWKDDDIAQFY